MNEVRYFLVPEKKTLSIDRDFDELIARASKYDKAVHSKSPVTIELEKDGEKYPSKLEIQKDHIVFTTTRNNDFTIENIRKAAQQIGYRTFSVELGCILPDSPYLRDLITYKLANASEEILLKAGYQPVFVYPGIRHDLIYAQKNGQKEIYAINPYMMEYYKLYGYDDDRTPEFSYIVAPNITRFAPLFDAGLIPEFYEGYRKRDKIYNYSYFNIYNPGRKVFVKPLIYELEDRSGKFFVKGSDKGTMILMDKIRPGETLHDTIIRFLKEYNLADDYAGAIVRSDIEMDRDREGILTPRLIVAVYVEKLKSIPQELKRSWIPTPKD